MFSQNIYRKNRPLEAKLIGSSPGCKRDECDQFYSMKAHFGNKTVQQGLLLKTSHMELGVGLAFSNNLSESLKKGRKHYYTNKKDA